MEPGGAAKTPETDGAGVPDRRAVRAGRGEALRRTDFSQDQP